MSSVIITGDTEPGGLYIRHGVPLTWWCWGDWRPRTWPSSCTSRCRLLRSNGGSSRLCCCWRRRQPRCRCGRLGGFHRRRPLFLRRGYHFWRCWWWWLLLRRRVRCRLWFVTTTTSISVLLAVTGCQQQRQHQEDQPAPALLLLHHLLLLNCSCPAPAAG